MTKRDFFILIIKLFGLYAIVMSVFSDLPFTIFYVIQDIDWIGIAWLIGNVLIMLGLFYVLLTQADAISDLLGLHKGFDDNRIDLNNLKVKDLIKLALLLLGGLLIVQNIPEFLTHTFYAFKSSIPKGFDRAYEAEGYLEHNNIEDYVYWISSAFNILIGYLLVTNFNKLSNFLNRKISE